MSQRDSVVAIALYEASFMPVCWREYPETILDYFHASTNRQFDKAAAIKVSWCSYFVHWVLIQARVPAQVKKGMAGDFGGADSVSRFMKHYGGPFDSYLVGKHEYTPKPGDLYNRVKPNNHIGIVVDVRHKAGGGVQIQSVDGNSGPGQKFSQFFDNTINPATHKVWVGCGFVYHREEWFDLAPGDSWICLTHDE